MLFMLSPWSVSSYIAAIRFWHIDPEAPHPTSGATRLARLLLGIRRSCTSPVSIRLPVTNSVMGVLQATLTKPQFDHVVFWAACCSTFFGFLKVGEITCSSAFLHSRHLALNDIALNDIALDAGGHYFKIVQNGFF